MPEASKIPTSCKGKMKHFLTGWSHLVGAHTQNKDEGGCGNGEVLTSAFHAELQSRDAHQSWSLIHFLAWPERSRRPQTLEAQKTQTPSWDGLKVSLRWHRLLLQRLVLMMRVALQCYGRRETAWWWWDSSWGTPYLLSLPVGGSPLQRLSHHLASRK